MKLLYLYVSLIVFALLPYQLEGKFKPFDIYLILCALLIAKAFIDHFQDFRKIDNQYLFFSKIVVASLFITTAFSSNPKASLIFSIRFLIYFLLSVAIYLLISSEREYYKTLEIIIHIANITSVIGLLQLVIPPEHIPGLKAVEGYAKIRIFSTFGNPNFYAEYLALCIPLAVALAINERVTHKKMYLLLSTSLLSLALIYTYTRGSFIGLLIALAAVLVILSPRYLVYLLSFTAIIFLLFPPFMSRFVNMFNLNESSQGFRLKIWNVALQSVSGIKEWLVGTGPYTFLESFRITVINNPVLYFGYFQYSSHNIYLLILVEGGLMLLFSWLLYFSYLIFLGIRSFFEIKKTDMRLIAISISAGLFAIIINGLTSSIFYHPKTMLYFFTFAGLLLASFKFKDQ